MTIRICDNCRHRLDAPDKRLNCPKCKGKNCLSYEQKMVDTVKYMDSLIGKAAKLAMREIGL